MGTLAATETVTSEFAAMVAARPDAVALRWRARGGNWAAATWRDYGAEASAVAAGLAGLGLERGDRVALLMRNRPEFHFADIGTLLAGGVPISIYNSTPADQLGQLLTHCRARVVVADDSELLERVLAVRDRLADLHHVVVVDDRDNIAPADVLEFAALADASGDMGGVELGAACEAAGPGDLATVIYTSGTTGPPKGVMLTHANVVATAEGLRQAVARSRSELAGKRVVSYLPMAHIAERVISHYEAIGCGLEVTTCPEVGLIARYLAEVHPHIAFGVPRIWERLHTRVAALLAGASSETVRQTLGLDEAEFVFTGSAPTSPPLIEWFRSMGIPMAEIYGLSETTGAVATETAQPRAGWAGRPLPGVEVRLAGDAEILVRGPNVFAGYLDDAPATEEAIGAGGWFRTGDVGEVDGDGYVRVVDRKKELIVTAGGKKVSPANLEAALKDLPLVTQAAVVGEGRPFLVALVVLDADTAAGTSEPERAAELERGIAAVNAGLSPPERIRRWAVLDTEWPPDSDELTPTMKLRRRHVEAKYAAEIAALYDEPRT